MQRDCRESENRRVNLLNYKGGKMEHISHNWLWKDEQSSSITDNGNCIGKGEMRKGENKNVKNT